MTDKLIIKTQDIQLLVYDFDGVMTDNKVLIFPDGEEAIVCNRNDGLAINILKAKGLRQLIISTEFNKIIQVRAGKIGLLVINAVKDKKKCLLDYCRKNKLKMNKIVYVGNEVNDLEVMKVVGWPVCPQDAHWRIKKIAKTILTKKGGEGVIREVADILSYD